MTSSLISVIITCFNHGRYLSKAIESVLLQHQSPVEILVIDDGSTDNTKEVSARYPTVRYIYQSNQGLSAARNTGITQSSGSYILFLDADDWLLPKALATNFQYLVQDPQAAFVSGAFEIQKIDKDEKILMQTTVETDHYLRLLEFNYISMIATVLFRRSVFDEFMFDTSLKACEDYDLYLKVARKYPVIHHTKFIAVYRFHDSNMSYNTVLMMEAALTAIKRQEPYLKTPSEKESFNKGITDCKIFYSKVIYGKYLIPENRKNANRKKEMHTLWINSKSLYFRFFFKKNFMSYKVFFKKHTPGFILRGLHNAGVVKSYIPVQGKVGLGDLDRTTPLSKVFGYDRGGPIDRYYIENFLKKNANAIHGRVLEIGENVYTLKFGGSKVVKSDILHVDERNKEATFYGDLSNAPNLPDNSFDCIVLTQTLHLIYDHIGALKTCYRILKPGGKLLLTVPGISHIDQGEWMDYWLWSYTKASITKLLKEAFSPDQIVVETHGNVLTASGFLFGLGVTEIEKSKLDHHDPHYQLIITAVATK